MSSLYYISLKRQAVGDLKVDFDASPYTTAPPKARRRALKGQVPLTRTSKKGPPKPLDYFRGSRF